MTHRGATGANPKDGDGAGVMSSIPHEFFSQIAHEEFDVKLPASGRYAVGNLYLNPEEAGREVTKRSFEDLAAQCCLKVGDFQCGDFDLNLCAP